MINLNSDSTEDFDWIINKKNVSWTSIFGPKGKALCGLWLTTSRLLEKSIIKQNFHLWIWGKCLI